MSFARWVFRIAGIYGVLVIAPMYFLESRFPAENPPPITHPEFFYGFVGVTLAWAAGVPGHLDRSAALSLADAAGDA